ncbi:hypothetical protein Q5762_16955 [Streptomyces sp. P9(2023)]|nr:hypothetical protein [Streptomyces sp. P9(2023)]MDT9690001.1 hypothetical protein [Streptomyces sp. P9(2023)]
MPAAVWSHDRGGVGDRVVPLVRALEPFTGHHMVTSVRNYRTA